MDDALLTVVTMRFSVVSSVAPTTSGDPVDRVGGFLGAAARYVVLSRGHAGCRNIDLCRSVTEPDTYVVLEKWADPVTQRAHLDHPDTVAFARSCEGLLTAAPHLDLLEAVSAHDLA